MAAKKATRIQKLKQEVARFWCHEPEVFAALLVERGQFRFQSEYGDRFYGWIPSAADGFRDLKLGELYLTCSDDSWSVYRTVNARKWIKYTPWVMSEMEKEWLHAVHAVAQAWAKNREYSKYEEPDDDEGASLAAEDFALEERDEREEEMAWESEVKSAVFGLLSAAEWLPKAVALHIHEVEGSTRREFSSYDDLHGALVETAEEEWSKYAPYDEGEAAFSFDPGLVGDALSKYDDKFKAMGWI